MTNFEKIKNMSVEELADKISWLINDCDECPICKFCKSAYLRNNYKIQDFDTCSGTWKQWFKSEVEE